MPSLDAIHHGKDIRSEVEAGMQRPTLITRWLRPGQGKSPSFNNPLEKFLPTRNLFSCPGFGQSRPMRPTLGKEHSMSSRLLSAAMLGVLVLPGCNNTLNPFCGSARPAPLIGSLSPSTVSFSQVEQGSALMVKGSQFVSSSVVVINGKALSTTVSSNQQLQVMLTTGVISGPGPVNVSVKTPSGNTGDVGCTSGGNSSVLVLTVN